MKETEKEKKENAETKGSRGKIKQPFKVKEMKKEKKDSEKKERVLKRKETDERQSNL